MVSVGLSKVTKQTISDFKDAQPFDLRLMNVKGATPNSNCDLCFLKSEATLAAMAREHPERAQWWIDLEQNVQHFPQKTKHEVFC